GNRILHQTSYRFSCDDQRLPPGLESAFLLAAIRRGADAQLQSGRRGRLCVNDAFDFSAVPLARTGNDGETVARRGPSPVAGLPVFCATCESRLFCRAVFSAIG